MIKRSLDDIAKMLKVDSPTGHENDIMIEGVSIDTRTLVKGNLFIPIIGEIHDGHRYVLEAIKQGAVAFLWQSDHGQAPLEAPSIVVENTKVALQQLAGAYRNELDVRIIGITGSNGKTTTKDFVASILETTYETVKTEGNFNNEIGLPLTLLTLKDTTQMAVLEMGMSERGEIAFLSQLAQPEAVIITNVGEAHLQQLGSRANIAKAKLEIIYGLKKAGLLVYNGDEPLLEQRLGELKSGRPEAGSEGRQQFSYDSEFIWDYEMITFRYGKNSDNDYYPAAVMLEEGGCNFVLNVKDSPTYYIPTLGQHNVINALGAIAVGKYMGVLSSDIEKGLRQTKLSGMRLEIVKANSKPTIINDAYNASPSSVNAVIQVIEDMRTTGRKIIVLADMLDLGEAEVQYHRDIGARLLPENIDYVFTYGKLAKQIAEVAKISFADDRVNAFDDKQALAEALLNIIKYDDIILFKGSRGMQLEDVVTYLLNQFEQDDEIGGR